MSKFKKFINQPTVTSFGGHYLPLWKSVLYDYLYPIIWLIRKIKPTNKS